MIIACDFAPGSYPYAELYKIKIKEYDLIKVIEKFKENNPDYCVPLQTQLQDGRSNDRDDHWYHIYFYYKDENRIIYTWIRQYDKETTNFALVAINEGLVLGHWKDINKDFNKKENKLQKEKFEKRILSKIEALLK